MDWGSSRPDVTQCFPLICCSRSVRRPCSLPRQVALVREREHAAPGAVGRLVSNRVSAFCQLCFRPLLIKACLSRSACLPTFYQWNAYTRDGNYDHVADREAVLPTRSSLPSIRCGELFHANQIGCLEILILTLYD